MGIMLYLKLLFQVEICLKNYHTNIYYAEPRDKLVLKSKCFDSNIKLPHGLVLFQREHKSFLRNSTMRRSGKEIT